MIIDILLLVFIFYGLYLGYEHGVIRVAIITSSIILGLFLSMYLTAPTSEFLSNFFGIHFRLLPLVVFVFFILFFFAIGFLSFKKAEKKLKNTKMGKTEKYFGAFVMSLVFSFFYAVILNFFSASKVIHTETRENSFSYNILERFSNTGIEFVKNISPFVSEFLHTISADEIPKDKKIK